MSGTKLEVEYGRRGGRGAKALAATLQAVREGKTVTVVGRASEADWRRQLAEMGVTPEQMGLVTFQMPEKEAR